VRHWLIDGNNVYGSRPDGWWNDRPAASGRFAQCIAEWCRSHDDDVTLVFDAPVPATTLGLAGGNLIIEEAPRRGRNAADDHIIELIEATEVPVSADDLADDASAGRWVVITSDKGLRARLPQSVTVHGAGWFRDLVGY
jgi:hypothetical protein